MYKYIHLLREKRRQASHHTTNSNFFEEQVRGLVISYFSITALKSWNYNWFQLTFPWDFSAFFQINIFTCLNLLFIQGKLIILYREPKWSKSHSALSDSLWPHGLRSPWNSPGQNTGLGSLSLLQGIFPTQESNSDLPHCRQILYQLSHKGSPSILEWVPYPFSSRSSWPRNRTGVSCTEGGFFTNWAIGSQALCQILVIGKLAGLHPLLPSAFSGRGVESSPKQTETLLALKERLKSNFSSNLVQLNPV